MTSLLPVLASDRSLDRGSCPWPLRPLADALPEPLVLLRAPRLCVAYANQAARRAPRLLAAGAGDPPRLSAPVEAAVRSALAAGLPPGSSRPLMLRSPTDRVECARLLALGGGLLAVVCPETQAPYHALVVRGRLSATEARLCARVRDGWSNDQMARSFGVPEGTIKSRLSRLYRRLGATNRAGLLACLEGGLVAEAQAGAPSVAAFDDGTTTIQASLDAFFAASEDGYTLRADEGLVLYENEAARRLRGCPVSERLVPLGGLTLCRQRPCPEAGPLAVEALGRSLALSPRRAALALLLAQGHSCTAIARALGIRPSTARTTAARLYAQLGARSRSDVVRHVHAVVPLPLAASLHTAGPQQPTT